MSRTHLLSLTAAAGLVVVSGAVIATSLMYSHTPSDVYGVDLGYARACFDSSGFLTLRVGRRVLLSGGIVQLSYSGADVEQVQLRHVAPTNSARVCDVSWQGEGRVAVLRLDYHFDLDLPILTVRLHLHYKRPAFVDNECLFYESPCTPAYGFSREARWERMSGPHWFTEVVKPYVSLGRGERAIHLTGHNTFALTRADATGSGTHLSLFADSQLAHPFIIFPNKPASLKREENSFLSQQRVGPGIERVCEVAFWIGGSPVFFRKQLQPQARRATLVFSEHADRSLLAGNLAVYLGASDMNAADFGKRGLIGRGLKATKTVFYTQLQDPQFKAVIDRLHGLGIEIGPHTMREATDGELLDKGLRFFEAAYGSRVWIDHGAISGPGTDQSNEEDLAVLGWDRRSPHYLLERLDRHHYDYAWNYYEQDWPHDPAHGLSFNMLYASRIFVPPWIGSPVHRKVPGYQIIPLLLCYNNRLDHEPLDHRRIFLFATYPHSLSQLPKGYRFLYSETMVDGLVEDRGIHVGHCYLASKMNEGKLFTRQGDHWEIDPVFDGRLANIGRHVRNRDLWNPTLSEWGDYLTRVLPSIEVSHVSARACRITNTAAAPVAGFTIAIKLASGDRVSCTKEHKTKRCDDDMLVSFDLAAQEQAVVRVEGGGSDGL